jgi:hypothetical protein
MAKAGKKHTHRATKPPLPDEQQEAEAEAKAEVKATVEKLRPFTKRFREDYERAAAEASEVEKEREAIDRMIKPPPAAPAPTPAPAPPAPAPTPTPIISIAPLKWVYEEVALLKVQGVAYAGIGKYDLAGKLVGRMQAAVKAGRVDKLWSVGHMANELGDRGLWPVA